VISIFWNVNGLAEITVARDGKIAACIRDVVVDWLAGGGATISDVEGDEPALVGELVDRLSVVSDHAWEPVAFAWAAGYTGAGMPADWLIRQHASAAFVGG
jgi:hypothetical protein